MARPSFLSGGWRECSGFLRADDDSDRSPRKLSTRSPPFRRSSETVEEKSGETKNDGLDQIDDEVHTNIYQLVQ